MPKPTKGPRFGGSPAHQRIILGREPHERAVDSRVRLPAVVVVGVYERERLVYGRSGLERRVYGAERLFPLRPGARKKT